MIIDKALLYNYRNYSNEIFEFSPNINFIIGNNGQGKTNLVEAIYFAKKARAFRTINKRDLINYDKEDMQVSLLFYDEKKDSTKKFTYFQNTKETRLVVDGKNIERKELFGMFPMVLFEPENLRIIKDGPVKRRNFLDENISMYNSAYLENLITYNKALKNRNILLKEMNTNLIDYYEEVMAKTGTKIIIDRVKFIDELNKHIPFYMENFFNKESILNVNYDCFLRMNLYENYDIIYCEHLDFLRKIRNIDSKLFFTKKGIHSDDIDLIFNGKSLKKFASTGQVRISTLSLYLSLAREISQKAGKVILLLDDVFSELDEIRRHTILDCIKEYQCIITSTDLEGFNRKIKDNLNIITIDNGKIGI